MIGLPRRRLLQCAGGLAATSALLRRAHATVRPNTAGGSLQTRMPFWGAHGAAPGGVTLTAAFTAESGFTHVRPFWLNSDVQPYRVDAAAVAPTAALGDAANPLDPSGNPDPSLWQPVTFAGRRSGLVPAATQATTGIIPANDRIAGLLLADLVPLASLPRTDGVLPLVLTRSYSANGMDCAVGGDVLAAAPYGGGGFDAVSAGRIVRAGAVGGDAASSPGAIQASPNIFLAPSGVQFVSPARGLSLMVGGDSLFQGFGTLTHQNDPFHIAACALSTPAFPITVCKAAYQGMSSAAFQANLVTLVSALGPDVVFLKGESPNDIGGGSASAYAASLGGLISIGTWCAQQGIVPVASTAEPFTSDPATELNRLAYNAQIRNSGWYYVDFDAAVSDGASPAHLLAQDQSWSLAPHQNDAGDAAIAGSVEGVLRTIIAAGAPG